MDDKDRALTELLGHTFRDERLLEVALTHRSAAFEAASARKGRGLPDNERMEFLGDAVLALVVSDALWVRYPESAEGELTRMRAAVVNETRLAEIATGLGLGGALRLGRGEDATQGRVRPSVLVNTLEAVFAAVYLDAGIEPARAVILRQFIALFDKIDSGDIAIYDEKTRLQELLQRQNITPRYEVVSFVGPDHDRVWHVEVRAGEVVSASGQGRNKKAAEQDAALNALKSLKALEAAVATSPTPPTEG